MALACHEPVDTPQVRLAAAQVTCFCPGASNRHGRATGECENNFERGIAAGDQTLLGGGRAHASFEDAVKDFPPEKQGVIPESLPYSGWQLLEHLRIAQRDILDFCRNEDGSYKPLQWPKDYWPKKPKPPNSDSWDSSVKLVLEDRAQFEQMLNSATDNVLVKPFAWGDGQTLVHEALLIADHGAYHVGELVLLRRLLGVWKS